jgi:hypothetical protein
MNFTNLSAWYIVKERRQKRCDHPGGPNGRCTCNYEMYFDGNIWDMARHNALRYSTKEEAESAAFLLVVKQGEDMGKVTVKEMEWNPDEGE